MADDQDRLLIWYITKIRFCRFYRFYRFRERSGKWCPFIRVL